MAQVVEGKKWGWEGDGEVVCELLGVAYLSSSVQGFLGKAVVWAPPTTEEVAGVGPLSKRLVTRRMGRIIWPFNVQWESLPPRESNFLKEPVLSFTYDMCSVVLPTYTSV